MPLLKLSESRSGSSVLGSIRAKIAEAFGNKLEERPTRRQVVALRDAIWRARAPRPPASWFTKKRTLGVRRGYADALAQMPADVSRACVARYGRPWE